MLCAVFFGGGCLLVPLLFETPAPLPLFGTVARRSGMCTYSLLDECSDEVDDLRFRVKLTADVGSGDEQEDVGDPA
jgi:hypothetical protein